MKVETIDIWELKDYLKVIPTNLGWTKTGENVMGAGLAKQAAERYPDLTMIYGEACQEMRWGPTGLILYEDLILFPVKPVNYGYPHLSWKAHASFDLIAQMLTKLHTLARQDKDIKVAIPLIGTGNGKLDKGAIITMISTKLDKLKRDIILVLDPALE